MDTSEKSKLDHFPEAEYRQLAADKAVEEHPSDEDKQRLFMELCESVSAERKLQMLCEMRISCSLREARERKRKRDELDAGASAAGGGQGSNKFAKKGFAGDEKGMRVLILATGSVATVKIPELVVALYENEKMRAYGGGHSVTVKVVASQCGFKMLEKCRVYDGKTCEKFEKLNVDVLRDDDEWEGYDDVRCDRVVHIELRRWADICLVAPCSANTLAKAACGISDNLIMSVLRAWDPSKPLLVAPAMNTVMWEHPKTAEHLNLLQTWGYRIVPPAVKKLACNDTGRGALAHVSDLVQAVCEEAQKLHECARGDTANPLGRLDSSGIGAWAKKGFAEWV